MVSSQSFQAIKHSFDGLINMGYDIHVPKKDMLRSIEYLTRILISATFDKQRRASELGTFEALTNFIASWRELVAMVDWAGAYDGICIIKEMEVSV